MTVSHWTRSSLATKAEEKADVLIIGGGYVGLSTAWWLSEMKPDLSITVIERNHCGSGASGKNAGFLTKGSASFYRNLNQKWGLEKAKAIFDYADESLRLVHKNILQSSHVKFESTKSFTLIRNEEQLKSFELKDLPFSWKESEKHLSQFQGAFVSENEFKVHPLSLLENIKSILLKRNIKIIEDTSAFELNSEGVRTDSNTIRAKNVILAMNGYLDQFHSSFNGIILPKRAQMLSVELQDDFECEGLYYDPPERVYWRKEGTHTLLIGGKRLLDEHHEVGQFEKISEKIQDGLELYLKQELKLKYKVIQRWSGIMGFTHEELPIISKIKSPLPTFVAGGFSGHGMGLGFKAAQEVSELVLGIKAQSLFSNYHQVDLTL